MTTDVKDLFPLVLQNQKKDCGIACINMILAYYKIHLPNEKIITESDIIFNPDYGLSFKQMELILEKFGFEVYWLGIDLNTLTNEILLPCILFLSRSHYSVLYKIEKETFFLADPAIGYKFYSKDQFIRIWIGTSKISDSKGKVLLILLKDI